MKLIKYFEWHSYPSKATCSMFCVRQLATSSGNCFVDLFSVSTNQANYLISLHHTMKLVGDCKEVCRVSPSSVASMVSMWT